MPYRTIICPNPGCNKKFPIFDESIPAAVCTHCNAGVAILPTKAIFMDRAVIEKYKRNGNHEMFITAVLAVIEQSLRQKLIPEENSDPISQEEMKKFTETELAKLDDQDAFRQHFPPTNDEPPSGSAT